MDFDTFYKRYCETLLSVDDSIGRVLDCLKEMGQAESTLVFYMGDNGFCFGEHGLIDKRTHVRALDARAAAGVLSGVFIKPGRKVTQTGAEHRHRADDAGGRRRATPRAYGRPIAAAAARRQGRSHWRDAVFYEYYWEAAFPQTPTTFGVRTDAYKFIHYHGIWDIDELYDMQNDPDEMHNLIDQPEHKQLVGEPEETPVRLARQDRRHADSAPP